jgi:hypothetical protein
MPKRNEYPAAGTFTTADIEGVRQRLLERFTGCEDFVPQGQQLDAAPLDRLPRLDHLAGLTVAVFRAEAHALAAGTDPQRMAAILDAWQPLLPLSYRCCYCRVAGVGKFAVEFFNGRATFRAQVDALLNGRTPGEQESILNRIIQAARLATVVVRHQYGPGDESVLVLPVRIDRETFQATGGYSPRGLWGAVSGASAEDLGGRLRDVLRELAVTPQEYAWGVAESAAESGGCPRAYEALQQQDLPGEHFRLHMPLLLNDLSGLVPLQFLAGLPGQKHFLTTLSRFPLSPDPSTRKFRLARVLVRTTRDGLGLSLVLPDSHAALVPEIGSKLGLVFPSPAGGPPAPREKGT